ncbi:MAG: hypothetical protein AB7G62_02045 [Magnetospirillum sp.]
MDGAAHVVALVEQEFVPSEMKRRAGVMKWTFVLTISRFLRLRNGGAEIKFIESACIEPGAHGFSPAVRREMVDIICANCNSIFALFQFQYEY